MYRNLAKKKKIEPGEKVRSILKLNSKFKEMYRLFNSLRTIIDIFGKDPDKISPGSAYSVLIWPTVLAASVAVPIIWLSQIIVNKSPRLKEVLFINCLSSSQ